MNYIELINRYWREVDIKDFTPNETNVYFRLLDVCNRLGWQNPFTLTNGRAAALMGISENTLATARRGLAEKGLISFRKGSRRVDPPTYCFPEKVENQWVFTSNFEAKPTTYNKTETETKISTTSSSLTREEEEILGFDKMAEEAKANCPVWIESMAAKLKVSEYRVREMIDTDFRRHFIVEAHAPHQNLRDFQSHFFRWATIELNRPKATERSQSHSTDRYARRRGFEPSFSTDPKDWAL